MKRTIILRLAALVIISGLCTSYLMIFNLSAQDQEANIIFIPEVGNQSPDFSLEDLKGDNFTLSEVTKDKIVLLWFTNLCGGCQARINELERIKNLYEKKGIEIVGVSVLGEDRKTVERALQQYGITFRFLFDPKKEVTKLFGGEEYLGVCPLKNTFLIGKDRKIIYIGRYPGIEESELKNQLDKVVGGGK